MLLRLAGAPHRYTMHDKRTVDLAANRLYVDAFEAAGSGHIPL